MHSHTTMTITNFIISFVLNNNMETKKRQDPEQGLVFQEKARNGTINMASIPIDNHLFYKNYIIY